MARMARLVVPGYPHHVIQRGNRRQQVFFNDADYARYIEYLAVSCAKAATAVWAYCLMPNHVHLVMVPRSEDGLRAALGEAHRHYTRHINFREPWRGHLWQERFHSFVMDEPHLLTAVRYIERNPVRARLCENALDWPWSSARAHVTATNDALVDVAPMTQRIADGSAYLASDAADERQVALQRHSRSGRPLGRQQFIDALERLTGRGLKPGKRGPKRASGD
jgi:REP-associated tyrosine transposase